MEKASEMEYTSNWKNPFDPVEEKEVPYEANIISFHVIYRIKIDEHGKHVMKPASYPMVIQMVTKNPSEKIQVVRSSVLSVLCYHLPLVGVTDLAGPT